MRAMCLYSQSPVEENPLKLSSIEFASPGPDEALIKVHTCGVCRTDLHTLEGDLHPPKLPLIPGHQIVGTVVQTGEKGQSIRSGDRVGLSWLYQTCGECSFCQADQENLCSRALFTGFHVDGGFAEYVIAKVDFLLPMPASISNEDAAPLLCAGMIGYRSLRKAELKPGEKLGLVGFGASAHLAIQVANYWGCECYVFTRSKNHKQHAHRLGATWVGGLEDKPPGDVDRAILFAPSGELVPQILNRIRPGGTLAINAIHLTPIPEMKYMLIYGERSLRSVTNVTRKDGTEFLKLAEEIPIKVTTKLYQLDQANQALIDLKHSKLQGEAVLSIDAGAG